MKVKGRKVKGRKVKGKKVKVRNVVLDMTFRARKLELWELVIEISFIFTVSRCSLL